MPAFTAPTTQSKFGSPLQRSPQPVIESLVATALRYGHHSPGEYSKGIVLANSQWDSIQTETLHFPHIALLCLELVLLQSRAATSKADGHLLDDACWSVQAHQRQHLFWNKLCTRNSFWNAALQIDVQFKRRCKVVWSASSPDHGWGRHY